MRACGCVRLKSLYLSCVVVCLTMTNPNDYINQNTCAAAWASFLTFDTNLWIALLKITGFGLCMVLGCFGLCDSVGV